MTAGNSGKQQKPKAKPRGRPFPKGTGGNPSGRPAGYAEYREKCREYTDASLAALAADLGLVDKRAFAAKTLLEHGWGRPTQAVEVPTGDGGAKVTFTIDLGGEE